MIASRRRLASEPVARARLMPGKRKCPGGMSCAGAQESSGEAGALVLRHPNMSAANRRCINACCWPAAVRSEQVRRRRAICLRVTHD